MVKEDYIEEDFSIDNLREQCPEVFSGEWNYLGNGVFISAGRLQLKPAIIFHEADDVDISLHQK